MNASSPAAEVKKTDTKPVKLRSACNNCFSAKVRCDGDKSGCKRCRDKHLDCTYSESMVGKVVGKRRKRPQSVSNTDQQSTAQWNVHVGPMALPSPAPTESSRASIVVPDMNLACPNPELPFDFTACDQSQFVDWEMSDQPDMQSIPFNVMNGLPTPCVSPPQMPFMPMDGQLHSRSSSIAPSAMPQPSMWQMAPQCQRTPISEDDETVCIKLLAHLKRASLDQQCSLHTTFDTITKTNAAMKRLLQRPKVQADYTCHLLFTNILTHLTTFCEALGALYNQEALEDELEFINESFLADDQLRPDQRRSHNKQLAKNAISDASILCQWVHDLLQRKPLNGYQTLGRHESTQILLKARVDNVVANLH